MTNQQPLFEYQPSERESDLILRICTHAVQSGKRIAIFQRPADLRDMSLQDLREATVIIGVDRAEAKCRIPALMLAFRLYERIQKSHSAHQTMGPGQTAEDNITVSTDFSRQDLQHFLNSLQTNPDRLQEFEDD